MDSASFIYQAVMPDWLKIIIPSIAGVIVAYFSARWGARRAFQERWWDKKERAYAEIIESLYDAIRYCELAAAEELHGLAESAQKEEIEKKSKEAYWKIQKATDIGAFLISAKAAAALQELRNAKDLDPKENPWFEVFEERGKQYRATLEKIRDCALKDLRVKT